MPESQVERRRSSHEIGVGLGAATAATRLGAAPYVDIFGLWRMRQLAFVFGGTLRRGPRIDKDDAQLSADELAPRAGVRWALETVDLGLTLCGRLTLARSDLPGGRTAQQNFWSGGVGFDLDVWPYRTSLFRFGVGASGVWWWQPRRMLVRGATFIDQPYFEVFLGPKATLVFRP
jgi:hypothetical protein